MLTMTTPLGVLLAFAGWTLLLLTVTVGWYRWSRILTRRAAIHEFPAEATEGAAWYRRATRAHANCLENLPVYTAIVLVAALTGVHGAAFDRLSLLMMAARIVQSAVHVALEQTARVVSVRFSFYMVQVACMVAMGVMVVTTAG